MTGLVTWVGEGAYIRAGFTKKSDDIGGGFSLGPYAGLNLGFHVGDQPEHVKANRAALNAEVPGIAWMSQVHGDGITFADASRTPEVDALILAPGSAPAAAVMVADCVPLLLFDRDKPLAAAVHVGRAGLLKEIASKAVAELTTLGAEHLVAIIGPSICGQCYEVPKDMREAAEKIAPGSASQTRWGTPSIDIPRALNAQLEKSGVFDIVHSGVCTYEDTHYFSHRRNAPCGRFAGVVEFIRDTPR